MSPNSSENPMSASCIAMTSQATPWKNTLSGVMPLKNEYSPPGRTSRGSTTWNSSMPPTSSKVSKNTASKSPRVSRTSCHRPRTMRTFGFRCQPSASILASTSGCASTIVCERGPRAWIAVSMMPRPKPMLRTSPCEAQSTSACASMIGRSHSIITPRLSASSRSPFV
eukprot:Amastigsp_a842621_140.p3 type:complete len:168 gc:universal Amastigsp_a842621_140:971-468(-)